VLAAVDPRIAVTVPVVMVSAHFFGGCECESACRSIAARNTRRATRRSQPSRPPRPMLVISDGEDWTKNVPVVEFPYIQNVYRLYGARAQVENLHLRRRATTTVPRSGPGPSRSWAHSGPRPCQDPRRRGRFDEASVALLDRKALAVDP
jgi:hypothetical protein